MSSPTNQMNTSSLVAPPASYSPVDAVNRHDFGVQKNRKPASTGGGRAWSEDEEVYLLQTRLQKMPYKHIAAHLKKTELACRLHYHQLSHGSNRRKSSASVASSRAGSVSHSPVRQSTMPSPISESAMLQAASPTYTCSPQSPEQVQLPSAASLLPRSVSNSPPRTLSHPVAILPKPIMPRRTLSDSTTNAPLRLDCGMATNPMSVGSVDKERLRHIYEAHRASFWSVIASDYGPGVSPFLLEEAWKATVVSNAPPTPCISPDTAQTGSSYPSYNKPMQQLPTPVQENKNSATSISALLGIDASPRSPKERELIKRMEENRDVVMA